MEFLRENKKKVIIAIVALLLLSVFAVILFDRQSPTEDIFKEQTEETGTSDVKIVSITPADNASDVGLLPEIKVNFSKNLSSDQQNQVIFTMSPEAEGTTQWESNGKTVVFKVTAPLTSGLSHQLSILYPGGSDTLNFTTKDESSITEEEALEVQTQADKDFGEWQEEIYTKYPWINELPLRTDKYFVYFDIEKGKIFAVIYSTDQNEIATLREEITQNLSKLGIDASIPVEWSSS